MDWPIVSGPKHHSIAELFFRTLGVDQLRIGAARVMIDIFFLSQHLLCMYK